jgi:hypothetical protein
MAVLIYGLFLERNNLEWLALAPAAAGLLASALLLAPIHRLFFDEDIYINVASNLTRAPVNQVTVMGGPHDIQVSTYPKEPAGWPILLSIAYLAAGPDVAHEGGFLRDELREIVVRARNCCGLPPRACIAADPQAGTHGSDHVRGNADLLLVFGFRRNGHDGGPYGGARNVGIGCGERSIGSSRICVCGSNSHGTAVVGSHCVDLAEDSA